MKPGPKPIPSNIRLVTGGTHKNPTNPDEPKPPIVIPDPPEEMSESAQKWWNHYANILVGMRVLTEADAIALTLLCETTATYFQCLAVTRRKGVVVNLSKDKKRPYYGTNPYHTEAKAACKQMERLLTEFGCTPSSRPRVNQI